MIDDIDELFAPLTLTAPVRSARCGESFHGGLEAGREWFRAHIAADHPNVQVNPRLKLRPSLHSPGPRPLTRPEPENAPRYDAADHANQLVQRGGREWTEQSSTP